MDLPTRKSNSLESLFHKYKDCEDCSLAQHRNRLITGTGNPNAKLFLVIDKFTESSRRENQVLTGPYKHLLDTVLTSLGSSFDDVWISPVVLCAHRDNKSPKVSELKACRTRLLKELHVVQPDVIVALGSNSIKTLIPRNSPPVTTSAGMVYETELEGDLIKYKIPTMITYSLSFLLRNPDNSPGGTWNKFFTHVKNALLISSDAESLRRGNYDEP